MPKDESILHSMLVVSGAENFGRIVKNEIISGQFMSIDMKVSGTSARQIFAERFYDIIVVNMPLADESGLEFAMDIAEQGNASVLLVCPNERYVDVLDMVTDDGILAIAKPFPRGRLSHAIRYLMAEQKKRRLLQKKIEKTEEKLNELRVVSKAKVVLVEKEHMTEEDAHRLIGKKAMDNGISRRLAAERILDEYED